MSCNGAGDYPSACHLGGPVSVPGQSMWGLWWTKWHWNRVFSTIFATSPNTVILPMFHTHYWFYDWSYVVLANANFVSITNSRKRLTFLTIKPTRCTNLSNLFLEWNSTGFGQFLCPSSGVLHCTHSNGVSHTGLLKACEQDQDGTLEFM